MGRRSRKRGYSGTAGESRAATTTRAQRDAARERRTAAQEAGEKRPHRRGRASIEDRPPPPWGNFPLVELLVLAAIGLFVAGLIVRGQRGGVMVVCALVLGALAGVELSIREHFAGFRSHSSLLAGLVAVPTATATAFIVGGRDGRILFLPVLVVVFGVAFWLLREAFKRRSGGLGFRA